MVTPDPEKVEKFAQIELGMLVERQQPIDLPQFCDADLCHAGVILRDALESDDQTSGVMFEAMSRVLLVKLLQKYGQERPEELSLSARLTSDHFKRFLAHVRTHLDQTITLDRLAHEMHFLESPEAKTSDIRAAFAFVASLPEVDPKRLNGVGICASAGYMGDAVSGNALVDRIGFGVRWTPSTGTSRA